MKKRTVITTETREVWVIRESTGDTGDLEMGGDNTDPFADAPLELPDEQSETHTEPDKTRSIRTEEHTQSSQGVRDA